MSVSILLGGRVGASRVQIVETATLERMPQRVRAKLGNK